MAALRLIDVLPDFGVGLDEPSHLIAAAPVSVVDAPIGAFAPPPVDVEERVRQAVAEARAALEERLNTRHEQELQAERERHAAERAAQARQFGEDAAHTIAAALAAMEERLAEHFGVAVARILGSLASLDLQKRSIDALAQAIRDAVADREAVRLTVRGPQFLYEALEARLPERAGSIDYAEADGFELTVAVDGTLLETRLGEWAATVSEALS